VDNEEVFQTEMLEHINAVSLLLYTVRQELSSRACTHDRSKLTYPEREIFVEYTPKLKGVTYGSDKYKMYLAEMKRALDHHYLVNAHHPEHCENGIAGMTLVDLLEMLCDWVAATKRHADGSLVKSLEHNAERFSISPDLQQILINTAKEFGWLTRYDSGVKVFTKESPNGAIPKNAGD